MSIVRKDRTLQTSFWRLRNEKRWIAGAAKLSTTTLVDRLLAMISRAENKPTHSKLSEITQDMAEPVSRTVYLFFFHSFYGWKKNRSKRNYVRSLQSPISSCTLLSWHIEGLNFWLTVINTIQVHTMFPPFTVRIWCRCVIFTSTYALPRISFPTQQLFIVLLFVFGSIWWLITMTMASKEEARQQITYRAKRIKYEQRNMTSKYW